MKKLMTLTLATIMMVGVNAQNPNGRGMGPGNGMGYNADGTCRFQTALDLSEDQLGQLEALRVEHQKEMLDFKNKMGEISAKSRTIMSSYPIDTKTADKLTDEKTALMNSMGKARNAHLAAVKNVLTEEQALKYSQMKMVKGNYKQGKGRGQFKGNRSGRGYGQGRMQGNRPGCRYNNN